VAGRPSGRTTRLGQIGRNQVVRKWGDGIVRFCLEMHPGWGLDGDDIPPRLLSAAAPPQALLTVTIASAATIRQRDNPRVTPATFARMSRALRCRQSSGPRAWRHE
jgi:hypothetical protein